MLSRIISGKDAARVEPAVFPSASHIDDMQRPEQPEEESAQAEAEIRDLREQVRHLHAELERAKRESLEAGRRQGDQQARTELSPVLERVNASIAEITGLRTEMRRRAEKDVVNLALMIAKRILHREVGVDPNALNALARVVFERLARAESYRVTVHPLFAAAIQNALPAGQNGRVQLEPDPTCAPGTLIVRSDEGIIDASVDSQLEEITRGLTDRLAHSGATK
jgi:flagellar assembly protein FliH